MFLPCSTVSRQVTFGGVVEEAVTQKDVVPAKDQVEDRIHGLILGAAIGSSLGAAGLGLNYKELAATTGLTGLRDFSSGLTKSHLPDHSAGDLLADSLLGMELAEVLIEGKGRFSEDLLKDRIGHILENPEFLKTLPGAHCLAGLRKLVDGIAPGDDLGEALHANAAARVFAAGTLPGGTRTDEPVDVAVKQALMSHNDKRAAAAAAVVADSIAYFIHGGRLETADQVRSYVGRQYQIASKIDERFAESWDDVAPDLDYANPADDLPYSLINVESTVTELVPTAAGVFLIFRHDPEEAICAAARSGGDTDTVATIVGALAGAYHGASKLPERWKVKIAQKDRLETIARQLAALWN